MTAITPELLKDFRVEESDHLLADPELHCKKCRTHLCDIEGGDTMAVIVGVIVDHICPGREK